MKLLVLLLALGLYLDAMSASPLARIKRDDSSEEEGSDSGDTGGDDGGANFVPNGGQIAGQVPPVDQAAVQAELDKLDQQAAEENQGVPPQGGYPNGPNGGWYPNGPNGGWDPNAPNGAWNPNAHNGAWVPNGEAWNPNNYDPEAAQEQADEAQPVPPIVQIQPAFPPVQPGASDPGNTVGAGIPATA